MSINLLPWRKTRYTVRKQQFYLLLILCLSVMLSGWSIFSATPVMALLRQQLTRDTLQQHIAAVNAEYQLNLIAMQRQQQQLQMEHYLNNSLNADAMLMQLLHELREQMPPDMYLTQLQKNTKGLRLSGKATSHAEITLLLKNLEHKIEHGQPELTETQHANKNNPEIDFDLLFSLTPMPTKRERLFDY